jgi:hypothetical protein
MKPPFLRKTEREEPLVVSMTGARLGDRILYVGATADLFKPLAARVGLSGQTTVVAANADALKAVAERAGLLIDGTTAIPTAGGYDLVVVEARGTWVDAAKAGRQAVRPGGRLIVIACEPRGWLGRLRASGERSPGDGEIERAVEAAGWTAARAIGGRDGFRFVEAFKR